MTVSLENKDLCELYVETMKYIEGANNNHAAVAMAILLLARTINEEMSYINQNLTAIREVTEKMARGK